MLAKHQELVPLNSAQCQTIQSQRATHRDNHVIKIEVDSLKHLNVCAECVSSEAY